MKYTFLLLAFALSACATTKNTLTSNSLKLASETANLAHCESVVYDIKRDVLYVSVQADKVKGDGSIATVSLDGKILNSKFIAGLNNPKGIALHGDKLYVSDVTELVEVDLSKAKVTKKYKGKNAKFLNDVAVDMHGNVFVSDMHNSSIYKLDGKKNFKLWHASPEMENPNGLWIVGHTIYIAAWGPYTNDNPGTSPPGRFLKLDMGTKAVSKITEKALGHLDGLQVYDSKSFITTDWMAGKVFQVFKNGTANEILDTEKSVGDALYLKDKKLLALPMNRQNKLMIYTVN